MALSFHLDDNVNRTMRNRNVDRNTQISPWRSRQRSILPETRACSEFITGGYDRFDKKAAQVQRPHGTMKDPWSRREKSHVLTTRDTNKTLEKWRNKRATLPEFSLRDDRGIETRSFKPVTGGSIGDYKKRIAENISAHDLNAQKFDYGNYVYSKMLWSNPLNKDYNYTNDSSSGVGKSRLANSQGNINYASASKHYDIRTYDKFMARRSLHHRAFERDRDEEFQAMEFTEKPRKRYNHDV